MTIADTFFVLLGIVTLAALIGFGFTLGVECARDLWAWLDEDDDE